MVRRAVISVSNKSGVVDFARELAGLGVEILSTGGTAKSLRDAGIPVREVADHTGFPEMLDGRVKTLHPKIHGGILFRRGVAKDNEDVKKHGIEPIDMVVVNLYPFEETVAKPGVTLEDAIENIDIGGPTMIRAAAKNYQDVAVVVDPADYGDIIAEMKASGGAIGSDTKLRLALKVFRHTSRYDTRIAEYLTKIVEG